MILLICFFQFLASVNFKYTNYEPKLNLASYNDILNVPLNRSADFPSIRSNPQVLDLKYRERLLKFSPAPRVIDMDGDGIITMTDAFKGLNSRVLNDVEDFEIVELVDGSFLYTAADGYYDGWVVYSNEYGDGGYFKPEEKFGLFLIADGMSADRFGNIYIIDGSEHLVYKIKYNSGDATISSWSIIYTNLVSASDIDVCDGEDFYNEDPLDLIFIADYGKGSVIAIDKNGQFKFEVKTYNMMGVSASLTHPISLACIKTGGYRRPELVVLDEVEDNKYRLHLLNFENLGGYINIWGLPYFEINTDKYVRLRTVNTDGLRNIWVVDGSAVIYSGSADRIHKFTRHRLYEWEYIGSFGGAGPAGCKDPRRFYDLKIISNPRTSDPNFAFLDLITLDKWMPVGGFRLYKPGTDVVDISHSFSSDSEWVYFDLTFIGNDEVRKAYIKRVCDNTIVSDLSQILPQFYPGKYRIGWKILGNSNDLYLEIYTRHLGSTDENVKRYYFSIYKSEGHLYSSSSVALSFNNQRKISQAENSILCFVYESMDKIWLVTSADGSNWSSEIMVSSGFVPDLGCVQDYPNRYPSVVARGHVVNIVWQLMEWNGSPEWSNVYILLRRYDLATRELGPIEVVSSFIPTSQDFVSSPVIDAYALSPDGSEDIKMVAWREPSGIGVRYNDGQWSPVGYVPGTGSNSFNPSIVTYNGSIYSLCWEDRYTGSIKYVECGYFYDGWYFSPVELVSPYYWFENSSPSISAIQSNGLKPVVVWRSYNNIVEGSYSVHFRMRGGFGSGYGWGNIVSFSDFYKPNPVVGTYRDNNKIVIVWDSEGSIYCAKFNGSSWSGVYLVATSGSGVNVNSRAIDKLIAVWRGNDNRFSFNSTSIQPDVSSLSDKSSDVPSAGISPLSYRLNRHAIFEIPKQGMIGFEIAGVEISNSTGKTRVKYSREGEITPGFLSTEVLTANKNDTLIFSGAFYGRIEDFKFLKLLRGKKIDVELKDARGSSIRKIWGIKLNEDILISADSTFGEFRRIRVEIPAEFIGKEIKVDVNFGFENAFIVDDYIVAREGIFETSKNYSDGKSDDLIPKKFDLYQNYPNPFNSITMIRFDIPERDFVRLVIYDVLGREVKVLFEGEVNPGTYMKYVALDEMPSGVYFYSLISSRYKGTKKMVLIK